MIFGVETGLLLNHLSLAVVFGEDGRHFPAPSGRKKMKKKIAQRVVAGFMGHLFLKPILIINEGQCHVTARRFTDPFQGV